MNNNGSIVNDFLKIVGVIFVSLFIFLLVKGIQEGNQAATMVAGAISFLVPYALGWASCMLTISIVNRWSDQRAKREQEGFIVNAKENLAIMQQVANAQGAQARAQSAYQVALARALPAPSGAEQPIDALVFEDEVFDGLS